MKRFLEVLQALALTGIIVLILVLIWFALSAKPKVELLLVGADAAIGNLNTVAQQAAQAVTKLNAATDAETAKLQATTEEARKTERAFRAGIDSLRQVFIDLHQDVVPAVAKTVQDTDTAVLATTADLHKMTLEAQPVLENASRATASAADTIADPAIRESLDNLAQATQNASQATADASASMKKVRAGVEYEVDQLMKPVRKVKVIGEEIVRLIGKFLGF